EDCPLPFVLLTTRPFHANDAFAMGGAMVFDLPLWAPEQRRTFVSEWAGGVATLEEAERGPFAQVVRSAFVDIPALAQHERTPFIVHLICQYVGHAAPHVVDNNVVVDAFMHALAQMCWRGENLPIGVTMTEKVD